MDVIGWKKGAPMVPTSRNRQEATAQWSILIKLRIPAEARRSIAPDRRCRAEYADVLEVIGAIEARDRVYQEVVYRPGERVVNPEGWNDDWTPENPGEGIYFFLSREEAEDS